MLPSESQLQSSVLLSFVLQQLGDLRVCSEPFATLHNKAHTVSHSQYEERHTHCRARPRARKVSSAACGTTSNRALPRPVSLKGCSHNALERGSSGLLSHATHHMFQAEVIDSRIPSPVMAAGYPLIFLKDITPTACRLHNTATWLPGLHVDSAGLYADTQYPQQ